METTINPCCCTSLKTGTKIIGYLEIAIFGLLFLTDGISLILSSKTVENSNYLDIMILSLTHVVLGTILVISVNNSFQVLIKSWLDLSIFLLVRGVAFTLVWIFQGSLAGGTIALRILSHFTWLYALFVVYAFYKELREDPILSITLPK